MSLTFQMAVFDEPTEQVDRTAAEAIRQNPSSRVTLILDGPDVRYSGSLRTVRWPVHLKNPMGIALWWELWLRVFLDSGSDYALKIDPDSEVLSEIPNLPPAGSEAVFAARRTITTSYGVVHNLHGGAMGFTRPAAERIVRSGWLHDRCYVDNPIFRDSTDAVMSWVVTRNRIPIQHRTDFCCGGYPVHLKASVFHK